MGCQPIALDLPKRVPVAPLCEESPPYSTPCVFSVFFASSATAASEIGMASPAPKRMEPLESLKFQRQMRTYRLLRRVCMALCAALLLMVVVWGATRRPWTSFTTTQTLLVWSRDGVLGAAFVSAPPGADRAPRTDRRSLATVVLLVDQPRTPPNWIERQLGGPLVYTTSFTLASLDPTAGFEPLSEADRAGLGPLLERKCASMMPGGPQTIPPLNGTRTRFYLGNITGPILGVLAALFVISLLTLFGYGFVTSLLEGLRSGISPRACPACDFDLRATPPLPEVSDDDAKAAPATDGRVYRLCPECGWKGRV